MNAQFGAGTIVWQRGYGLVTFAEKNLSALRRYVHGQQEHHRSRLGLNQVLESCGDSMDADNPEAG